MRYVGGHEQACPESVEGTRDLPNATVGFCLLPNLGRAANLASENKLWMLQV